MEEKNQDINLKLITRYLSAEASQEERSRVEQWLNAKPVNSEIFNEYKILWDGLERVQSVAGLDLDAEWARLEAKLADKEAIPVIAMKERHSRAFFISRIAVAAILVLVLSLGGILIFNRTGYQTLYTENNTVDMILPDASRVTLNAYSGIQYRKKFRGDMRKVSLHGEAFFEVEPDINRPFIIEAGDVEVIVLGTSFNVKAYEDNSEIEVVVSSGRVALSKPGEIPETIILNPGNKGIFSRSDQSLEISRDIDKNYLAWKTRSFIFEDQPLVEVVMILNRVYHSSIAITSDSLKEARITTTFNNQTLEAILNVLSATLDFDVKHGEDEILLSRGD
jgi:ferric-dicitrate binding protein FerR (iron transport regulator)